MCVRGPKEKETKKGQEYSTSIVWDWCMALIAFCAIALVENVTNAHPVGRAGGGGTVEGRRGRAEGQEEEEEGRQERTKTRQKVWTHRCYKKPNTDTKNSSQADNSVPSCCRNNSRKTSTVSWQAHVPPPLPDPVPPAQPRRRSSSSFSLSLALGQSNDGNQLKFAWKWFGFICTSVLCLTRCPFCLKQERGDTK